MKMANHFHISSFALSLGLKLGSGNSKMAC